MFTIGEFSRITGLTVKALRFYHEQGLLVPTTVDDATGYRYYDRSKVEVARTIGFLKGLDFSLAEIRQLLATGSHEEELTAALERQRKTIDQRIRQLNTELERLIRIDSERKPR